jgi:hypothetical protein
VKLFNRSGGIEQVLRGRLLFSEALDIQWDQEAPLDKVKAFLGKEMITLKADEKIGILDVTLQTPQGEFRDTRDDVELDW